MIKYFVKIKGGAGNQLFQYAFARAFSIKNNVNVFLNISDYFGDYKENLKYPRDFFLNEINCQMPLDYSKKSASLFDRIYRKITGNYNVKFDKKISIKNKKLFFDGYWQSPLYFNSYIRQIMSDFDVRQEYLTAEYFDLLKLIDKSSICVHIRLGDYLNPNLKEAYGLCSKEYYIDAINWLRVNQGAGKVFLFSDDPSMSKEMLVDVDNLVVISRPTLKLSNEFSLMRKCQYFVISNSSLSWWAAYLETVLNIEKICISPNPWFDDGNLYCETLIPGNWLRMKK